MALTIDRATKDLITMFKKEKFPGESKKTYWNILSEEIVEDGAWEDELIEQIKEEISSWLGKLKKSDFVSLWEDSETKAEDYEADDDPDNETIIDELSDELVDLVLNKIEDSTPREEFFIPEAKSDKKKFKDEDDDFIDDLKGDIFDEDDLDDFDSDDYFDDDRY